MLKFWSSENPSNDFDWKSVFLQALQSCPHITIAVRYSNMLNEVHDEGKMTDDEYRKELEVLLSTFGFDILGSKEIWQHYIAFEVDEFEDAIQMDGDQTQIQSLKEKVVKLFHRQLSLPLAGNEETLASLDKVLSDYFTEVDVNIIKPVELNTKYTRAMEMRECRITFESHLIGDSYPASSIEEKSASWMSYVKFEIQDGQIARAQRLFERSLADEELRSYIPHWIEFLSFSVATLKSWAVAEDISLRALKILSEDSFVRAPVNPKYENNISPVKRFLWGIRLIACEKSKNSSLDAINALVSTALSSTFSQADDYLNLLLVSCDAARRQLRRGSAAGQKKPTLSLDSGLEQSIQYVTEAFNYAEVYLASYYPDWTEGWWRLYKYWAKVIDEDIKTSIEGIPATAEFEADDDNVWEKAAERFPNMYFFWQENINQLKSRKHFSRCSKLYKKLFQSKSLDVDRLDVVARDWLIFEQQYRDLDSLIAAWLVVFDALKSHVIQLYAAGIIPEIPVVIDNDNEKASAVQSKLGKRKQHQSDVGPHDDGHWTDSTAVVKKSRLSSSVQEKEGDLPSIVEQTAISSTSSADSCPPFSVQLRNLPFTTSEGEISDHLQRHCGVDSIVDMKLLLSKTGTFRGIVNVQLKDEQSLIAVLSLHESEFNARNLIVEPLSAAQAREAALAAKNKQEATKKAKVAAAGSAPAPHLTTVYVSKLPLEAVDADLLTFFASCGKVLAAKVTVDKKTGESKVSDLNGFIISVIPSRYSLVAPPKEEEQAPIANEPSTTRAVDNQNASSQSKIKTTTSFKPRSIPIKASKK
eukprot:gene30089-39284_t